MEGIRRKKEGSEATKEIMLRWISKSCSIRIWRLIVRTTRLILRHTRSFQLCAPSHQRTWGKCFLSYYDKYGFRIEVHSIQSPPALRHMAASECTYTIRQLHENTTKPWLLTWKKPDTDCESDLQIHQYCKLKLKHTYMSSIRETAEGMYR
jgi:hypothetical protein